MAVQSKFNVGPWKVQGKVDYQKLISEFKVRAVDSKIKLRLQRIVGTPHLFFRRDVVFAHRDLDLILDDYESGRGFFLYTGRAPSMGMHVGHLLPFFITKWFQDKFKVNVYIQIADDDKFLSGKNYSLNDIRKFSYENILDIIAIGFDPDKTFIFQDSEFVAHLYPLALRIGKSLNLSQLRSVFGFVGSTNAGLLAYPLLQIAAAMLEKRRCLIPAGIDQDPYWRLQRDIADELGFYKAAQLHLKFLAPLTGIEGKMSSSKPEGAIYLTDGPKEVKRKIMKYAFSGGQPTLDLQRKLGGDPDVDVSFSWLSFLFEPDDQTLGRIRQEYRSGKILSGELKDMLIARLNDFLSVHRSRRDDAKSLVNTFKATGELSAKALTTIHE